MKLSISHIAWPFENENYFLELIAKNGCSGLEVAPSRIWSQPDKSSLYERQQYKKRVNYYGLNIVAFHALLFNRPDLGLFLDSFTRNKTKKYLIELCKLASNLGAKVLVFGSPANRRRFDLGNDTALEIAADFFYGIAKEAREMGVCLCIEPLSESESDFITSAKQGLNLVDLVGSDGFGLHLDSKALSDEEDVLNVMHESVDSVKHFHVSEPELGLINMRGDVPHNLISSVLKEKKYKNYISIEMREQINYELSVKNSISLVKDIYEY